MVSLYQATAGSATLSGMARQSMQTEGALRVFAVDPGTKVVGWAVVSRHGRVFKLVACGAISGGSDQMARRLAIVHSGLLKAAREHTADEAAVEEVFAGRNLKAALAIGQGRGVALAVLGEVGLPVFSYPARVIKRAVTGNGSASKEQVARMAALQLGLSELPGKSDVTDACALAITHLIRRGP